MEKKAASCEEAHSEWIQSIVMFIFVDISVQQRCYADSF